MKFSEKIRTKIEQILAEYPIFQYGFLDISEIEFKEEVRHICKQECERYNTSWSCPPAVGTVKECRERCESYEKALLFTTLAEVSDISNMKETLATRREHEEIVHGICRELDAAGLERLALSSDSCAICESCSWPKAPCRHPDEMMPCIESYGILVTSAAEKLSMDFFYDSRTVVWYGMIFLRASGHAEAR